MSAGYKYNKDDEYHYVWCQSYVVRPPWVINSNPSDVLRTIDTGPDGHLLWPDWMDGHGPPLLDTNPSPPHAPPQGDGGDSDDDGDDCLDDDSHDKGPGGDGDGGDGDDPGSDGRGNSGKSDRDQGTRRGVKRSAGSMSYSSYAGVSVLEIGFVNDPFVAQSEAAPVKGVPEATDTVADSGATQHMFKHLKQFRNYREVQGYSIKVADGKTVPVVG